MPVSGQRIPGPVLLPYRYLTYRYEIAKCVPTQTALPESLNNSFCHALKCHLGSQATGCLESQLTRSWPSLEATAGASVLPHGLGLWNLLERIVGILTWLLHSQRRIHRSEIWRWLTKQKHIWSTNQQLFGVFLHVNSTSQQLSSLSSSSNTTFSFQCVNIQV